jgi:hypothetical protein
MIDNHLAEAARSDMAEMAVLQCAELFEGVAPAILRGRDAFLRDLPALLANPKYDRWSVAYLGNERIALSPSQRNAIAECLKRGLKDDEYFIGMVVPHEKTSLDSTLREFDE